MHYLTLGASASGLSCAKTLRELDPASEITVVSKDQHIYSRCMLHHYLSGKRSLTELSFISEDSFEKYNVQWEKGSQVIDLNIDESYVITDSGMSISFDKLLIATGSRATLPPVKNLNTAPNVYVFRDFEDSQAIKEAAQNCHRALIIGAGLVGLDACMGLLENHTPVTIVEATGNILSMQLDDRAAKAYKDKLEGHGVKIYTNSLAKEVLLDENGRAKGLLLGNGEMADGDLIIVAAGVAPNACFISNNSIKVDRGIQVDDHQRAYGDTIYASGDVTGQSAIWPAAVKQGIVAAYNMAGLDKTYQDLFTAKNAINFFDIPTISLGLVNPPDDSFQVETVSYGHIYKKLIHKDGVLYGGIFQGDVDKVGIYTRLIGQKINISKFLGSRDKDIFELTYADFYEIW